jgi:hypothetical protein
MSEIKTDQEGIGTTNVRMAQAGRPPYINSIVVKMKDVAYPLPLLFK